MDESADDQPIPEATPNERELLRMHEAFAEWENQPRAARIIKDGKASRRSLAFLAFAKGYQTRAGSSGSS